MMLMRVMMTMKEIWKMEIDQLKKEEKLEETKIFGYFIFYLRQLHYFGK